MLDFPNECNGSALRYRVTGRQVKSEEKELYNLVHWTTTTEPETQTGVSLLLKKSIVNLFLFCN